MKNIEAWQKQNLFIECLPTCCSPPPHRIEILWKKIAYEGLLFSASASFEEFKQELNSILQPMAYQLRINFS